MLELNLEEILKVLTPIGLAAAWIWAQLRTKEQEDHKHKLDIEDRERLYSERLEKRLESAQKELESALIALKNHENAEELLKRVVEADPGIMFLKKRLGPKRYIVLKVSKGYENIYLGGPSELIENTNEVVLDEDYSETDELVYSHQVGRMVREQVKQSPFTKVSGYFVGRKFPVTFEGVSYIIGVGDHEFDKEA